MSIKQGGSASLKSEAETALEPIFRSLLPIAQTALDVAGPYMEVAWGLCLRMWILAKPHADSVIPMVFGLILIFFGGSFPLAIAAIEAFRLCGWDQTKANVMLLWQQIKAAQEANKKDDKRDDDNDGIPDVQQMGSKALLTRKLALMMRATDPGKLHDAVSGILAGITAVIATLGHKFTQSIALGVSLGDMFTRTADYALKPTLDHVIPREHHKWIPLMISLLCRCIAIHIAWWCQRIISAMHSSMRGSDLFLHGAMNLMHAQLPAEMSPSHPSYPAAVTALAVLGSYAQLSRAFGIPFPFNLLLLPLEMGEWILSWTLAYGTK